MKRTLLALVAVLGMSLAGCECVAPPAGSQYACEPDGTCPEGLRCRAIDWRCVEPSADGGEEPDGGPVPDGGGLDACVPSACVANLDCGQVPDGCGGELDCGSCAAPLSCAALEPHRCGCPADAGATGGEVLCANGVDDDCDLRTDCEDDDCAAAGCDDGDPCTSGETCRPDGGCRGGSRKGCTTPTGPCLHASGSCDRDSGACVYPPMDGGVACASDSEQCTLDVCNGQGACVHPPRSGACSDDNPCSYGEVCLASGTCAGGTGYACSTAPGVCFLSDGSCLGDGGCAYPPRDAGAPCMADTNPCTLDVCNGAGVCTHPPQTGSTCNDGESCTRNDLCRADGGCRGTSFSCNSPPGECYFPTGTCLADGGCSYPSKFASESCDDGIACTHTDKCDGNGGCVGTYYSCGDSNNCTTDTCLGNGYCFHSSTNEGQTCGASVTMSCGATVPATVQAQCRTCQGGACLPDLTRFDSSCVPHCSTVSFYCSGDWLCCGSVSGSCTSAPHSNTATETCSSCCLNACP